MDETDIFHQPLPAPVIHLHIPSDFLKSKRDIKIPWGIDTAADSWALPQTGISPQISYKASLNIPVEKQSSYDQSASFSTDTSQWPRGTSGQASLEAHYHL